jgi:hypothetical protein
VIHPIRRAEVVAEVEEKAHLLTTCSAGKLIVEFNLKDGVWTLGNITVGFPKRRKDD